MNIFKFIGCILLIVSCMIGGGILALPIIAYDFGLTVSYIIITFAYIIMLISGLLTLEICLKLPEHKNNFSSIAEYCFGKYGKYFTILILTIIIYSIITAYINASPSIFTNTFLPDLNIPHQRAILNLSFTLILGSIVIFGIKYTDRLNRFIMGFKLIILFCITLLILIKIPSTSGFTPKSFINFSKGFAIILFVFSYQTIIPSITNYVGRDYAKYTQKIIFIAVTITFIISILWITATVSIIEPYSSEIGSKLTLSKLLQIMNNYNLGIFTTTFLKTFFNITLISSFIALSIAFIDILIDILKLDYKLFNRIITGLVVYLPCWVIANYNSDLFVTASAISGFCGLFIALLLPSIASYKLYKKEEAMFIEGKFIRAIMVFISICLLIILIIKA